MKILVCGGRRYGYTDLDEKNLYVVYNGVGEIAKYRPTSIVQGGAKGGDEIGVLAAQLLKCELYTFKADWDKYNNAAGPIRNKQMLETKPDLIIAFKGGVGTKHMISIAEKADIPIVHVNLGEHHE